MGNPSEKNQKTFDLNDLAVMVAKGFENTATKDDFKRLENRMDGMENRMDGMDKRMGSMEKSMKNLETGQEDIKLKLDNYAYRFELVELQRRVEILEKHSGISRS